MTGHPLGPEFETWATPRTRAMYDHWLGRCGGRAMPRRADFDPVDVPSLLPFIILSEVEPEPVRFRIRVVGTQIVDWYGGDFTGLYVDQMPLGDRLDTMLAEYAGVCRGGAPLYRRHRYWPDAERYFFYERLLLPLGDGPGRVTHLLAFIEDIPAEPES